MYDTHANLLLPAALHALPRRSIRPHLSLFTSRYYIQVRSAKWRRVKISSVVSASLSVLSRICTCPLQELVVVGGGGGRGGSFIVYIFKRAFYLTQ